MSSNTTVQTWTGRALAAEKIADASALLRQASELCDEPGLHWRARYLARLLVLNANYIDDLLKQVAEV